MPRASACRWWRRRRWSIYRRSNPPNCALSISAAGCPTIGKACSGSISEETPPTAGGNHTLQFVVRTRLKLFYRPPTIATTLVKEVQKLQWQQSGNNLRLTNSGPLHITTVNGALIDNKGHLSPIRNVMLRPYSSHTVMTTDSARLYQLNYIDDYGAVVPIRCRAVCPRGGLVILQGEGHHAVGRARRHRGVSLHILGVEIDRLGGTGAGAGHPFQDRQVAGLIDLNAGAVGHCRTGVIAVGQLHADAAGAVAGTAQGGYRSPR